jgi:hypothetical protein
MDPHPIPSFRVAAYPDGTTLRADSSRAVGLVNDRNAWSGRGWVRSQAWTRLRRRHLKRIEGLREQSGQDVSPFRLPLRSRDQILSDLDTNMDEAPLFAMDRN